MAEALDPLRLPLWGSRLIEASAGTGKTWTIAALYLRLVLGHGGRRSPGPAGADAGRGCGHGRPLTPDEILVMTFTRAATRELSDRIRARLLEAARCFRGESRPGPEDRFLADLLADHPPGPVRGAAAARLAAAADGMDGASVHTIDAWCQRAMREHAFESGSLFDEEVGADERALQTDAAHDYWRRHIVPLEGPALEAALVVWPGIAELEDDGRRLAELEWAEDAGRGTLGERIRDGLAERAAALAALKRGWPGRAAALADWLDRQLADKFCPFDRRKLHPRHYLPWIEALIAWAEDPLASVPRLSPAAASRLTPQGMLEALKPGAGVQLPQEFEAFEVLQDALQRLPTPVVAMRMHAAAQIRDRLLQMKQEAGRYGFSDLLRRLDRALDPAQNGVRAERLRQRLLAQHPVALIDEFQDTSPLQARLFDRLYRVAANDADTALLLIGDPKQAIYGFRGADIQSYLAARLATTGRHSALDTNHRSTAGLVAAVNHLFVHAEARQGEGAFMYRLAAPSNPLVAEATDPLPYTAVRARGRAETFVHGAGAVPALNFELDSRLLDATRGGRDAAARCAEHIVNLLNDPQAGFAAAPAGGPLPDFVRLRPADIAVLVRTGRQAAAVRRELRRRDVPSVYLSDRDSVLASVEASDLLQWLRAVADPRDARPLRAALATRTVGLSMAELVAQVDDDEALEQRREQLQHLQRVWQGQGVLAMLRQSLHLLGLPARCLGPVGGGSGADSPGPQVGSEGGEGGAGERRLTNLLHLAELLQAASVRFEGEQALIRWFSGQLDAGAAGSDDQIVRLESDAELVKVVTVHKAKGLEYPVVFLPFASSVRLDDRRRQRPLMRLPGRAGQPASAWTLDPDREQLAAADRERLREDLRLLYVALTRARHALWVGLQALRIGTSAECVWHRSAIGYLIGGGEPAQPEALQGLLEALAAGCPDIAVQQAPLPAHVGRTLLQLRQPARALRAAPVYTARFERQWQMASFSALVRSLAAPDRWTAARYAAGDDETPAADAVPTLASLRAADAAPATVSPGAAVTGAAAWHRWPRGPAAGQFLHEQLEWLAGEAFALALSPELQRQLLLRCQRQGLGDEGPALLDWMLALLAQPLAPLGVALRDLERPLPEMEFWLPCAGLPSARVDALCRAHVMPGRDRPALPDGTWRGLLMGFADLVFEHGGRYWVLDYKSNRLGDDDGDYTEAALEAAMAAHRYDVQAAIYLLALHRLLRARLGPRYQPAQQLGGALFYFLRGLRGPAGGCYRVRPEAALIAGMDALLPQAEGGA